MKFFMKHFYDKSTTRQEVKDPLEYEFICISCAAKLGGKVDKWLNSTWHYGDCSCCNVKKEVTQPRDFIWR